MKKPFRIADGLIEIKTKHLMSRGLESYHHIKSSIMTFLLLECGDQNFRVPIELIM